MKCVLLILSIHSLTACAERRATPLEPLSAPIIVETATAAPKPMPQSLPVTGALIANRRSEVAANASGVVVRTFVERGDFVKAGALLAQLDSRGAALSKTEASANLRNAQTQMELDQATCARNDLLLKQGVSSREDWERVNGKCQLSVVAVEASRARAQLATKSLSDATVRAPFAGTISERHVNVGEYVQPSTKIATLVELDPLRLQFSVSEAELGRVSPGQGVEFEVEAFRGERFTATIRHIDPSVRSTTRDLVVEATVANADRRLRPGMFATAHVRLQDEFILVVPVTAVRRDGAVGRIYAVVDGRVEERLIQLGPERDGFFAVLDGVKGGDRVVVKPSELVRDGVPVKDDAGKQL